MLGALIRKELLALSRDVHGLAALFLMPALFIVIMSLALKDVYRPPASTVAYSFDDRDQTPVSAALLKQWATRHGTALPLPRAWQDAVRRGELNYVLVVEPGVSRAFDTSATEATSRVRMIVEPGMGQALFTAMQADLERTVGELRGSVLMAQMPVTSPPEVGVQHLIAVERYDAGVRPSAVQQNVPAWLVFGMFFVVAALASLFVEERRCGALARLATLGVPTHVLIVSKALPYLLVNAVQAALMLAVGIWLVPQLGGDALSLAGVNWPAFLLVLAAIGSAAVSLALLLACVVSTHAQALAVGPILNVLMAAVGGVMVPTFVMPQTMQRVAEFSPMNWGLEGLLAVLLRGSDIVGVLPSVFRLTAFAGIMLLASLLLFRKRFHP